MKERAREFIMEINWKIVADHCQKYQFSCIPSAVEMMLKLSGKVGSDYYELQHLWDNKTVGSFRDFNGKTIEGLTFTYEKDFPSIDALFEEISKHLSENRLVAISLKAGLVDSASLRPDDYHMWIIYGYCEKNGDYRAFTKIGQETKRITNVKEIVGKMGTTDILVYEQRVERGT